MIYSYKSYKDQSGEGKDRADKTAKEAAVGGKVDKAAKEAAVGEKV